MVHVEILFHSCVAAALVPVQYLWCDKFALKDSNMHKYPKRDEGTGNSDINMKRRLCFYCLR